MQDLWRIHTTVHRLEGQERLELPGEFSQNMQTLGPSCGHADVQHLAQPTEASL